MRHVDFNGNILCKNKAEGLALQEYLKKEGFLWGDCRDMSEFCPYETNTKLISSQTPVIYQISLTLKSGLVRYSTDMTYGYQYTFSDFKTKYIDDMPTEQELALLQKSISIVMENINNEIQRCKEAHTKAIPEDKWILSEGIRAYTQIQSVLQKAVSNPQKFVSENTKEENSKKEDIKIGDIVVPEGTDNRVLVTEIYENGDCAGLWLDTMHFAGRFQNVKKFGHIMVAEKDDADLEEEQER